MSLCDIAVWLLNCHWLVIVKDPQLLSQQKGMGRAICISSNNSGNPSAKTWLRQATTVQVSGSSVHKQHGASFPSLALQGLLAKQTILSI